MRGAETRLQGMVSRCFPDVPPPAGFEAVGHRAWLALQGVWAHQLSPGRDVDRGVAQALLRLLVQQPLRS